MNKNPKQSGHKQNLYRIGFDVGSISLNTVILDENQQVVRNFYDYVYGKPFEILYKRLNDILQQYKSESFSAIAYTGSGGKLGSDLTGGVFVNEIIAQATAVGTLYPKARTIIEIGGEDSKLIIMEPDSSGMRSRLVDFEMNSICAAGTGSFLDQQAKRMGISIEKEFGDLALKSLHPPRIAGRCSVFAKSDMIHLQQIATPVHDIVAGLCYALARNFRCTVARSREIDKPVVFSGGVAANTGMVRAFNEILGLSESELIIPSYYASMGAIGALLNTWNNHDNKAAFTGMAKLEQYLGSDRGRSGSLPRLNEAPAVYDKAVQVIHNNQSKIPVYLGVDVGSLSTNIVLIDENHKVVARRYLPTASKPLEAIKNGMREITQEAGESVVVIGAGTTGSGRYLTGDFIGADIILNEITAQATAAIDHDPTVDTIFEIGGQDSKYISIENGVVIDFEMNKVCAAGTGSFLEEQAEKLNINIAGEFGELALHAKNPVKMGDRCTVFMESDLNTYMQKGIKNEDLVGGLAYAIVYNYLQKVVGNRRIGKKIFFQGGVTNNKAVVAAFGQVLGKPVIVPPHFDVTGAIGAAIAAQRAIKTGQKTMFKGFSICNAAYTLDLFTCQACVNHCEIRQVKIEGEKKPLFYGGRCEKWERDERKTRDKSIPDHFKMVSVIMMQDFRELDEKGKITIGIPRALMVFYEMFPFWRTFFEELGFRVVLSKESDRKLVTRSLESIITETCLPVELMHGHVDDLIEKKADYIFIPFIVNAKAEKENPSVNYHCPWVQSSPFMVRAALKEKINLDRLLIPVFHFRYAKHALENEIIDFFSAKFSLSADKLLKALRKADLKQEEVEKQLKAYGREAMSNIPAGVHPVVILGKPYNCGDPFLNLGLMEKLLSQNLMPVPIEILDLPVGKVFENYRNMCWPNGQKILAAARLVAGDDHLHAVYLSNFRCGPDSFLSHYVSEELKGKPYLFLEVDEHSADAGMITRIEAFVDSLRGAERAVKKDEIVFRPHKSSTSPSKNRVLYFPYMNDAGYAIAAAARGCGVESRVLPMQDQRDLEIGRKFTSSRECFPMICTTGSFIRKLMEPGTDPSKISFFMPDHNGPCRFGQYNHFQRVIFDRLGYHDVEIITPSNDSSYEGLAGGHGVKFRYNAWRGFLAIDYLRKLLQENRPYELQAGESNIAYQRGLKEVIDCLETGKGSLNKILKNAVHEFSRVETDKSRRKPVVSVVGEIFMRDNPFCSNYLVQRLEELGLETLIAPFSEWIEYSTYRYTRDSIWKGERKGYLKSKLQHMSQHILAYFVLKGLAHYIDHAKEIPLQTMLRSCNTYVHKDYDGDPPIAMGTVTNLAKNGISGVANILPFTCMPGTLITSVSEMFRHDHHNIPWINIAYDGQDTVTLETRLQAFAHQVKEFASNGNATPETKQKEKPTGDEIKAPQELIYNGY
jgi:predicted CoA-substrate-specific enzyme activase